MNILCEHGCGQAATHTTKGSLRSGPFAGRPVHQCSKSHNACPAVKQRKIDTSRKNYGTDYPWQTEGVAKSRENTCIERYGHKMYLHGEEGKKITAKTMLERYGTVNALCNVDIAKKAGESMSIARANDPTINKRMIATKRARYGENLEKVTAKIRETSEESGRWIEHIKSTEFRSYKAQVMALTRQNYREHKHLINPNNLVFGLTEHQLDHMISIRYGYDNNVPPEVIASVHNLEVLWHVDNKSKGLLCSQDLETLLEKISRDR